jgi:hypothetical protein
MKPCVLGRLNCSSVEMLSKVPLLMIHTHGGHVIGCKRHISVPTNVNNATFAGDYLVEALAVSKGDGDNLIARTSFALAAQILDAFARNWNQTLHCKHL